MVKKKSVNIYSTAEKTAKDYAAQQRYQQNLKYIKQQEQGKSYAQSRSGRFSSKVQGFFSKLASPTKALYPHSYPVKPSYGGRVVNRGTQGHKVGRPRGTIKPEYRNYGGVYNFRKAMAHQRRLERLEAMRRAAVNPQQRAILNQIEARNQYQRTNPENQVIPSTSGKIDMGSIMKEIDDAANAVA